MNVPCLIGAVIGCFYGGYLSDKFVLWRAKRRGGESARPEDRLWLMYALCYPIPSRYAPLWHRYSKILGLACSLHWSWYDWVRMGLCWRFIDVLSDGCVILKWSWKAWLA